MWCDNWHDIVCVDFSVNIFGSQTLSQTDIPHVKHFLTTDGNAWRMPKVVNFPKFWCMYVGILMKPNVKEGLVVLFLY